MDLFGHHADQQLQQQAPLAERLRPRSLDEFIGQDAILGPGRLLRRAIAADRLGSLILHGPPGTGKTTLARIIANTTRCHFSSLNAVLAGIKDLRAEVEQAQERLGRHGLRTLLFIDEVHRFNTSQQDALLPWVENGTVTLIGATTENPFFEVNKALVSRSRLFRLQSLDRAALHQVIDRALSDTTHGYGERPINLEADARQHLVEVAGGDARSLLNALELAVETTNANDTGVIRITLTVAEESIQQQAVLYDKQGDAHFDTISAFIKSIRGSDPDAALFWLARMVEAGEDPRFIFRRLLISAGEDIGLADPQGIVVVEACAAAFDRIGLPEGLYPLVQATLYLAGANKSNSALGFFDAVKQLRQEKAQQVPKHLRDANRDGAAFGDGVGYRYPHAYADHWVAQQYLPNALQGQMFYQPGALGWEGERRQQLLTHRAAQLAAAVEWESQQGEPMSSGPDDPAVERWLQRQLALEEGRLVSLQQRFWNEIQVQRHHNVLVMGSRSLLWALPALGSTPEGSVTLQLESTDDLERIKAQLQVLDPLQQPTLMEAPAHALQGLGNQRFELLIGRNLLQGANDATLQRWAGQLEDLLYSDAEVHLLSSHPQGGPAELIGSEHKDLIEAEQRWLAERQSLGHLQELLKAAGWNMTLESWSDQVNLQLDPMLLTRWFSEQATYRQWMQSQVDNDALTSLAESYQRRLGTKLRQTISHQHLIARR
jgi:putative ATPase